MTSYFYHLKLELYPAPPPTASKRRKLLYDSSNTTHTPYVPSPGADIFKSPLPAHRTSKWSSYTFAKQRPDTASNNSDTDSTGSPRRLPGSEHSEHGDALLLPERIVKPNIHKKSTSPHTSESTVAARPAFSNAAAAKDWRYDAVSIESIDMEASSKAQQHVKSSSGSGGVGGLHTKAVYIPSDPKTTDVGWGVVHLYRDTEESSVLDGADNAGTAQRRRSGEKVRHGEPFDPDDCTTLCILAVPSWMMPSDLLGFVGDQAREDVSHFRLIRTGRANKYMVLLKFRSAKRAREWQKAYNGRLFSVAEPENCHVVFVKSVEFLSSGTDEFGEEGKSFPQNNQHDPFTPAQQQKVSRTEQSLTSKPLAPPPPNLTELPTCPVCLERMDETTGLLTILCQHVFHCACLEKWRFPGSGCPVCRYTQSPSYTFPYPRPSSHHGGVDEESEPMCSVCAENVNVNLWICLICGNIGCGRYDSAHAYAHYEATSHCYAMDINTQHVWDYAGDGYVHRLIQSKPDFSTTTTQSKYNNGPSNLIDVGSDRRPRHENEAYRAEAEDMVPREKMESMANEYTYLLTSQLEGQRRYFEEQVERAVDKAAEASAKAEAATSQAEKAVSELETGQSSLTDVKATLIRMEKALEKSEKARSKFEDLSRGLSSQLREEKMLNEGLMKRIKAAEDDIVKVKEEAERERKEKDELKDLNHDLTMFISSQEKVKELQEQGEEVVEGGVGVLAKPEAKKGKGKGRKK